MQLHTVQQLATTTAKKHLQLTTQTLQSKFSFTLCAFETSHGEKQHQEGQEANQGLGQGQSAQTRKDSST